MAGPPEWVPNQQDGARLALSFEWSKVTRMPQPSSCLTTGATAAHGCPVAGRRCGRGQAGCRSRSPSTKSRLAGLGWPRAKSGWRPGCRQGARGKATCIRRAKAPWYGGSWGRVWLPTDLLAPMRLALVPAALSFKIARRCAADWADTGGVDTGQRDCHRHTTSGPPVALGPGPQRQLPTRVPAHYTRSSSSSSSSSS